MYTVSDGRSTGSPPHGSDSDSGDRILRRISKDSEAVLQRRSARRGRKQDAERKRRERLNASMIALKELVCKEAHNEDPSGDDSKLEKAQILEATVEYVRQKQHEEQTPPTQLYNMGFNTAAQLTLDFIGKCDQQLSQKLQAGLRDFLSRKAKELQDKGGEGEASQTSDAPGKCRSPVLRHCRPARHRPTQVPGRGERQREAVLVQTPSPVPSPRVDSLASYPSSRQSFTSMPNTPTIPWTSGMYAAGSANTAVMYPSPNNSPLPHYVTPEGLAPALVSPMTVAPVAPQVWPRSGNDGLHASVAAPYCRLNTSHNDSGYFSPSIAATSPFSASRGFYNPNGRVAAALPTPGVLNLSSNRHTGAQSAPVISPTFQSYSGMALMVPDSVTHTSTPFRARADSSTGTPVASPTTSRMPATSPAQSADEESRGSVSPDQPLSPEDREIASILTGAEHPSKTAPVSPAPSSSSPAPASKLLPPPAAPAPAPAPAVAVEPRTTWRPW